MLPPSLMVFLKECYSNINWFLKLSMKAAVQLIYGWVLGIPCRTFLLGLSWSYCSCKGRLFDPETTFLLIQFEIHARSGDWIISLYCEWQQFFSFFNGYFCIKWIVSNILPTGYCASYGSKGRDIFSTREETVSINNTSNI